MVIDVDLISHTIGKGLLYQHYVDNNVCILQGGVHRLHYFCTLRLLFCQHQSVIVSTGRVLIQEEAALAVLPGAGEEGMGWLISASPPSGPVSEET